MSHKPRRAGMTTTPTWPPVIARAKRPKKAPSKPLSVKPVSRIVRAKSLAQIEKDKRTQRLRERDF